MQKTLIIAEAALEHNGNIEKAKEMIRLAKWAGADIVKFQTFFGTQPTLTKYELTKNEWKDLFDHCADNGIEFASSPFDIEAIDFLEELGMKTWKIASGFVTHVPFLERIAKVKGRERTILSTGMAKIAETHRAADIVKATSILHCVSLYPCPPSELTLFYIRNAYQNGYKIGFSDHTQGIWAAPVAVALGATVIEKHFTTYDKGGPDAELSVDAHELKEMIQNIRNVEAAMGPGTGKQMENRDAIRKRMGCPK